MPQPNFYLQDDDIDSAFTSLSPTSTSTILQDINKDLTKEEEMELQKRLKLAKLEIANLIQEGQRLRLANEQLQKDIDLRSRYISNLVIFKHGRIKV